MAGTPADAQPWQQYLDARLREKATRAYVVRTGPAGPACPTAKINNYVLALAKRRGTLVKTRLRALADHVCMQQSNTLSAREGQRIARCRLLVLWLQDEPSTEGGQAVSAQLDAWLRTFALTQTKVLIFSRDPVLVLWIPVVLLQFGFDAGCGFHVLAPAAARLGTRPYAALPRSFFCGQCQSAAVCPVHERPPWEAATASLLSELGPKVICIRGPIAAFNAHTYVQALLDDNAFDSVLLYRTYADSLPERFPPREEHRTYLRERVKLVVLNMPSHSAREHADRVAQQTSTILRHVGCEVSRATQFLVLCQQQPELPCGWSVLSMDTRRDSAGQPPNTYINYMVPSVDMSPGHAPATDIVFSEDDYDTPESDDSDFDARSDAESVPDPQHDPPNFFGPAAPEAGI
jgi:hypothetical protein